MVHTSVQVRALICHTVAMASVPVSVMLSVSRRVELHLLCRVTLHLRWHVGVLLVSWMLGWGRSMLRARALLRRRMSRMKQHHMRWPVTS